MPPECNAVHSKFQVKCTLDSGHSDDHISRSEGSEIRWPQVKREVSYTDAQLEQMIGDHEHKLNAMLAEMEHQKSLAGDLINTFVPIMQTQLFLIKETLKRAQKD